MIQKNPFKFTWKHFAQAKKISCRSQRKCFIEILNDDVPLTMMKIPSGSFLMGSPDTEPQAYENEQPQHPVTISSFCLNQSPITQAQWKAVANFPQVRYALDPDPSKFKGSNRPVERVSWYEAVEFCQRMSQQTGRYYRLPSEAEWEYACRAGTTTPFHFGKKLPPELANFNHSNFSLGNNEKLNQGTTPVGSFQVANAFGLFDLHGNVYEWCADHWHDNYQGAPTDGSPWLSDDENTPRLLRGGFWLNYASHCRSAYRNYSLPQTKSSPIGFRVACSI